MKWPSFFSKKIPSYTDLTARVPDSWLHAGKVTSVPIILTAGALALYLRAQQVSDYEFVANPVDVTGQRVSVGSGLISIALEATKDSNCVLQSPSTYTATIIQPWGDGPQKEHTVRLLPVNKIRPGPRIQRKVIKFRKHTWYDLKLPARIEVDLEYRCAQRFQPLYVTIELPAIVKEIE